MAEVKENEGTFEDGKWWCACDPPTVAERLQVKKETPNQGRWFYRCPLWYDEKSTCDYFQWEDRLDPERRMTSTRAVDKVSADQGGAEIEAAEEHGVPETGDRMPDESSKKRKWGDAMVQASGTSDIRNYLDSFNISSARQEEGRQDEEGTDDDQTIKGPSQQRIPPIPAPVTPSKPRGNLGDGGLFTPTTRGRPSTSKRAKFANVGETTPSKTRKTSGVLSKPQGQHESNDDDDCTITEEVIQILKDQSMSEETECDLRTCLERYEKRMRSIQAGRDFCRRQLREIEAKTEAKMEAEAKKREDVIARLEQEIKAARKALQRAAREIQEHWEEYPDTKHSEPQE
ncbi:hypothetical protein QBC43DRAFT_324554 [Cladorrhinum sp. PSN259]|nr:hypothetical protein QBC43DRAFT_324554 [Cladorrhinum sp. PSN259]